MASANIVHLKSAHRQYECPNHLGNVLETVSDKKLVEGTTAANQTAAPAVASHSDYWPFGAGIANRSGSSSAYRFGFNGMEREPEHMGQGNSYTTMFRQYHARLGKWLSMDPKSTAWESPYASMGNSPIMYADPLGDTVKYGGLRDRLNVFLAKTFNKGFREDFRAKQESADYFTYEKSKDFGTTNIIDAEACEFSCNGNVAEHMVYYTKGFTTNDISNNWVRGIALPFDLTFSIGKLSLGGLSGIGIGIYNIFAKKNIGWGMANRISFHNGFNVFGFGFGNYNKYNMFGKELGTGPEKNVKIDPRRAPGLVGVRVGAGKRKPIQFIDVLGNIRTKRKTYHLHFNLASKARRKRKLDKERVISLSGWAQQ